ncbi:hypothetical protein D3C84_1090190 [compost metagenome]
MAGAILPSALSGGRLLGCGVQLAFEPGGYILAAVANESPDFHVGQRVAAGTAPGRKGAV